MAVPLDSASSRAVCAERVLISEKIPYIIPGFHPVRENLLRETTRIQELWIAEGKRPGRAGEIVRLARERGIPVCVKKAIEMSRLFPDVAHQGFMAFAEPFRYAPLDSLITGSIRCPGASLLVALDHITDEGNLGSLIRTAAFFGAQGLVIPKDRAAGVSPRVLKRSAGAYVHLPVTKVVNMARTLALLEKEGFWILGASGESRETIYDFECDRDLVLVLGNEQRGLSRAVRKRCHQQVRIPATGRVESLNVAVAGGVALSEIARQRALAGR